MIIRDLSGMEEFFKAEQLQRDVWGADDTEDPADLMMVIQHEGGLVAGAFEGERLVGYVFGFPTREPHVQHSHRLAVHPDARGRSLALRLKRYQRDWCLARGITLVRWTFDPLRHTNAHLNIARLGAEVSTYHPDYYGVMKGINAGLPSDRLRADWHLELRPGPRHVLRGSRGWSNWPNRTMRCACPSYPISTVYWRKITAQHWPRECGFVRPCHWPSPRITRSATMIRAAAPIF